MTGTSGDDCFCSGFRTTAHRGGAASAGAVVRKPSEKERAGSGGRRCRARYGDFGAMPADVGTAEVISGVIVRRRGAGDAARDARQRELDGDLSLWGVAE